MIIKRFITMLLSSAIAVSPAVTCIADTLSYDENFRQSIIARQEDTACAVIYNDRLLSDSECTALKEGNTALLPFRAFAESIGMTVNYNESTRTVTATGQGKTIVYTLDDLNYIVKPNGRTYVPLDYIDTVFSTNSEYQASYNCLIIFDVNGLKYSMPNNVPNLYRLTEHEFPGYTCVDTGVAISVTTQGSAFVITGTASTQTDDNLSELTFDGSVTADNVEQHIQLALIKRDNVIYTRSSDHIDEWYRYITDEKITDILCGNLSFGECMTLVMDQFYSLTPDYYSVLTMHSVLESLESLDDNLSTEYTSGADFEISYHSDGGQDFGGVDITANMKATSDTSAESMLTVNDTVPFEVFDAKISITLSSVHNSDFSADINVPSKSTYKGDFMDMVDSMLLKPDEELFN